MYTLGLVDNCSLWYSDVALLVDKARVAINSSIFISMFNYSIITKFDHCLTWSLGWDFAVIVISELQIKMKSEKLGTCFAARNNTQKVIESIKLMTSR